jgi:hypothetical protein
LIFKHVLQIKSLAVVGLVDSVALSGTGLLHFGITGPLLDAEDHSQQDYESGFLMFRSLPDFIKKYQIG